MVRKFDSGIRKVFFLDVNPVVRLGRTKVIDAEDLPPLPPHLDPKHPAPGFSYLRLDNEWAFLRSVFRAVSGRVGLMAFLVVLVGAIQLTVPVLIRELVQYIQSGSHDLRLGLALALGVCLASIFDAIALQHYFFQCLGTVQMVMNGLNHRIFNQALILTRRAQMKFSTGDVVNYIGSDTRAVSQVPWTFVEVIYAIFMIVGVSTMLFFYIGYAAFAALLVLAVMAPLTKVIGKRFTKLDEGILSWRDKRVSLVSQVISAMRIVKYFHWQDKFRGEIQAIRDKEVGLRRQFAWTASTSLLLYVAMQTVVCTAGFATYVWLGHSLDAATVFPCIALFGLLEHPFGHMTHHISDIAAARVSGQRLANFLKQETLISEPPEMTAPDSPLGLTMEHLSVRYADMDRLALHDVDLKVKPGEKIAVVGPLGSGKSTLLQVILGEVPAHAGQVEVSGLGREQAARMAYVPQEAFIQNGTLGQNISFGSTVGDMNLAIRAAALDFDVSKFPGGLDTEIGEHGVNLSGGQKQRVSLARAVMQRPGLVLLDDPLSAVDAHTEATLVEDCIFGALAKSTVLAVTHRLAHLSRFDRIVFLEEGRVVAQGTYKELMEQSPRFFAFVHEKHHGHGDVGAPGESAAIRKTGSDGEHRITDEEDRVSGAIKKDVYFDYLRAMSGKTVAGRIAMLVLLIGSTLLATGMPILQNSWLSVWMNQAAQSNGAGSYEVALFRWMTPWLAGDLHNVMVYGVIGLVVLAIYFLQFLLWQLRSVAAGQNLHDAAMDAVMKTKVRFFDATPVGRILNRFSRDIDAVERQLPWSFEQTIRQVFYIFGAVVVLAAVMPFILLVIAPVLLIYYVLQRDYRAVAREAQRLHSISRSPRFAHFKETWQGLSVIRGFRRQDVFWEKFYDTLAENQRMFYGQILLNRWFSVRIPIVGALVSFGMAGGLLWLAQKGHIMAGTAGLVLLYALQFWGYLNWCMRSFSEAEVNMTSVERLRYYASLPPEPTTTREIPLSPDQSWPTRGSIRFDHVWVRYADHLPDVLRGLTLDIPGGSKVGFIGRTGAGKSTIFQTLFRFIEVQQGAISIDGVDIRRIPLARLRRSIAIIPQDPTLFHGTLRDNLDRFGEHEDEAIWRALERSHMAGFVRSLPEGLRSEVTENGHNFSQGQRQLFCLARALLINTPIIVMDEATASVDVETDRLIQDTIRQECQHQTVLIIAHRLGTVVDCDLVVELEDGKIRAITRKDGIAADLAMTPSHVDVSQQEPESLRS